MLHVILLLGKPLAVDSVDVDGGEDLRTVDPVIVVTHHLHIRQVSLEAALQEDQDVLLIRDLLALLLDPLLLHRQLLDPVSDLVTDAREVSTNLLIVLQDL